MNARFIQSPNAQSLRSASPTQLVEFLSSLTDFLLERAADKDPMGNDLNQEAFVTIANKLDEVTSSLPVFRSK